MMENGMHEYYMSLDKFANKFHADLRFYKEGDDDVVLQPMTMQQLKRAFIFMLSVYGVATIVFMLENATEIIVYICKKLNTWRNRKC